MKWMSLWRQILKLILKSFALRLKTKQVMMVWGGLLFVHLQFWYFVDFIVAFIICFMTIFSFLSNIHHFIQPYLCVFFAQTEGIASVYDETYVKDEHPFPSSECDQVGSVLFMTLMFIIDYRIWFNTCIE